MKVIAKERVQQHTEQMTDVPTDIQPRVLIQMFKGECSRTKDNILLSKVHLDGIPCAPCGASQIEVTFDINANENLNVSAQDKSTGVSNTNERSFLARTDHLAQEAEEYRDEACCAQQQKQQQERQQEQQHQKDAEQHLQKSAAPESKDEMDKVVTDVLRGESRTLQIFVNTDDSKTMMMDVAPHDQIQDVVRMSVGKRDVYVMFE